MNIKDLIDAIRVGESQLQAIDLALTRQAGIYVTHSSMSQNINYDAFQPYIRKALTDYREALAAELQQANDKMTQLEAVLNPPPEPSVFDTPNVWFEMPQFTDEQFNEWSMCENFSIAVCTADEWENYVASGKEHKLNYYGNDNGAQCPSQVIDAANDINAGLRVSGDPCNAVIIIKRSE